jgi:hypothetical protein
VHSEPRPADNSDEARARDLARELRHAADTLEQVPEFYSAYRRGELDFGELLDKLMYYDPDEPEIMMQLIKEYGPPPGDDPPHEP